MHVDEEGDALGEQVLGAMVHILFKEDDVASIEECRAADSFEHRLLAVVGVVGLGPSSRGADSVLSARLPNASSAVLAATTMFECSLLSCTGSPFRSSTQNLCSLAPM